MPRSLSSRKLEYGVTAIFQRQAKFERSRRSWRAFAVWSVRQVFELVKSGSWVEAHARLMDTFRESLTFRLGSGFSDLAYEKFR